jgi:hypothetical protein
MRARAIPFGMARIQPLVLRHECLASPGAGLHRFLVLLRSPFPFRL